MGHRPREVDMPDEQFQSWYDEANRRGFFKAGADLQSGSHEMRRRGLVSDPTHDHTSPDSANFATIAIRFGVGTGALDTPVGNVASTTFNATGISIQNAGSGTAHNTVSQNVTVYWNIKL